MLLRRIIIFGAIAIIAISWLSQSTNSSKKKLLITQTVNADHFLAEKKLEEKTKAAKKFIQQKGFNDHIAFFIDMSLGSGQNRFFVFDLIKDSLIHAGLVAHGNCFEEWLDGRKYSNVVGSGCTSLGKYRIGNPYTGKFGYSYKLYGLEGTNDNAFERTVVLHSHSCVPENETSDEICQSNGCPMVSPQFLLALKKIINNSAKPVLLWIYE